MGTINKKELINAYKSKPAVGGIYCIQCSGNERKLMQATVDMEGVRHRFEFAVKINACPDPKLRREWDAYGAASLTFTVLEEWKQAETQTAQEFKDDVDALLAMWLEKQGQRA